MLTFALRTIRTRSVRATIDDLLPVRFRNAADGKQLIAVRPAASYALKLSGAERIKQLRADDLTAAELALLANPPQDLLFEYDARANRLEVALVAQKAKYAGTIQIDAALDDGVLRESCRLRCVPESGRVDRVLVQFFPRRDTAPRWTLGGDDHGSYPRGSGPKRNRRRPDTTQPWRPGSWGFAGREARPSRSPPSAKSHCGAGCEAQSGADFLSARARQAASGADRMSARR